MPDFFTSKNLSQHKSSEQQSERVKFVAQAPILQNHYVVIGPLGQGGMGTVFMAQDTSLFNRLCVVKKLRLDGFNDQDKQKAMEFFQREAKILSELKHPNVVHIQAYFQERGNYYLVMEYVEGNNLQQLLKKRGSPFNEQQVIEWAITILNVLNYLHNHEPPVIYRDIKPSNIMLDTVNGIKLVDFGIARPYTENSENTHVVSGGYSPPEQYWGAADPRSDIYALGATMYYLLTGEEPIALQTCSPKLHNNKISDFVDKIVQRATSQDVWLRYQNAAEMLEILKNTSRQKAVAPYIYIGGTCVATLIFVLFALMAMDYFNKQPIMFELSSKSAVVSTTKSKGENINSQFSIDSASLANSEEIITDPEKFPIADQQLKTTGKPW